MTSTMRVQRLAVAGAVLAAGALVAGPASSTAAAPTERVSGTQVSTSASTGDSADSARAARRIDCKLRLQFKPRVGKRDRRMVSTARVRCGSKKHPGPKMPKIWTSIQLKQTKAKDRYKLTDRKNTRRNRSRINTFCPREVRKYTWIARGTVKLPKSAVKKQLKFHKRVSQTAACR